MSLFELLVICIVAFLVIKPEDLPQIVKKIKGFYSFFTKTKTESQKKKTYFFEIW